MQISADTAELQTSFDEEAGVGFNMHVGAEGWSSACKAKGSYASSQVDGEVEDSRHLSENKLVLEAKHTELVRQCGESQSEAGIQYNGKLLLPEKPSKLSVLHSIGRVFLSVNSHSFYIVFFTHCK